MNLEILTPSGKAYSQEVVGVQLPGITGSFEILDRHAPMVAALSAGKAKIIVSKNQNLFYQIESGFVEVLNNKVTVMVEGTSAL
jgi:F-type H+-transporting ATPase subunit epsilon